MWMHATCFLEFHIPVATPFLFMLRPRSGWQQWVGREQYVLTPSVPAAEFTDPFGNLCQRLVAPAGRFSVYTSVDIQAADASDTAPGAPFVEVQDLPDETLPFLLPSRFCESDRCAKLASSIVAGCLPGYDQCKAIVDHIHRTKRYTPRASKELLSACEVNDRQQAVCRDMAHLGIACCRSLSIPARMVVGYLEGLQPMDLHAWFEAFVGGRWYTFDSTQTDLRGGRAAIAYGRDAADVAIYTQFGAPVELQRMEVTVERRQPPSTGDVSPRPPFLHEAGVDPEGGP
ncbi:transglutaminase family protein [Synechococcus sp. BSF8S]|nr:transglutaminase family protein [Synechococcus sp. BSF8S]MBC1265347.1 transglutaminase family protein [Synechococcus sp. BSA11S]